jgi:hypothetical protein
MQETWNITPWVEFFDHWQPLEAGALAVIAALIAVLGTHYWAQQKERQEIEAIRLSLAVEIRQLVNILLETHETFTLFQAHETLTPASFESAALAEDVSNETSRGVPVVYPAAAARVGLLGRVAPYVVTFYANIEDIKFAGRKAASDPKEPVSVAKMNVLTKLIEKTCRSALPLLSRLPLHEDNIKLKAKIEAIGQSSKQRVPQRR